MTNKTVKSVLGWFLYIAILAGLVYGLPRALSSILDTEYPLASITSSSMWPALKEGDLVVIEGVDGKEDVEVGDIVVYKNIMGFTIHRVVELKEVTAITKGDANRSTDKPVKYKDIVGKALSIGGKIVRIPFFGNINIWLNK